MGGRITPNLHRMSTPPVRASAAAMAALSRSDHRFESREPISDVIPNVSEVKFSPSALRFATLSRESTNPYPVVPGRAGCAPVLWQVLK